MPRQILGTPVDIVFELDDSGDSDGLASLLTEVALPDAASLVRFRGPGSDAASDAQTTFSVLEDKPDLVAQLKGKPGHFYVGLRDPARLAVYREIPNVTPIQMTGPLDIAAAIMSDFSGPDASLQVFASAEAERMAALVGFSGTEATDFPGLAHFQSGLESWSVAAYSDALNAFDEAIASGYNGLADVEFWRGMVMAAWANELRDSRLERGDRQRSEQEEELLNRALEAFDVCLEEGYAGRAEAEGWRGAVLFELGRYPEAAAATSREIAAGRDDAIVHSDLGISLALIGELGDALDELNTSLRLDRSRLPPMSSKGVVLYRLGRFPEAEATLQAALRLKEPAYASTHFYLGATYSVLGKFQEALSEYEEADRLQYSRQEFLAFQRSLACWELKRYEEAREFLALAEKYAEPSQIDLLGSVKTLRALCLGMMNELERARIECEAAIGIGDTIATTTAHVTLAWVLLRLDRVGEAESVVANIESTQGARSDVDWRFIVVEAAVYNAAAELYGSKALALEVIDVANRGIRLEERATKLQPWAVKAGSDYKAQIFFERARAHIYLEDAAAANADLKACRKHAQRDSRLELAAGRVLRQSTDSSQLVLAKPFLISTLVVLLIAFGILLVYRKLGDAAFSSLTLGVLFLALASYALPVVTNLKLGTLEVQKVISTASASILPQIAPPPPPLPLNLQPPLQPARSSIPAAPREPSHASETPNG